MDGFVRIYVIMQQTYRHVDVHSKHFTQGSHANRILTQINLVHVNIRLKNMKMTLVESQTQNHRKLKWLAYLLIYAVLYANISFMLSSILNMEFFCNDALRKCMKGNMTKSDAADFRLISHLQIEHEHPLCGVYFGFDGTAKRHAL